jgi:hypothetical protein
MSSNTATAHSHELIVAVGDSSVAWSNYQKALKSLQSYQDDIRAQTDVDANYAPGKGFFQIHAEKSAKVAQAWAHYAVFAGRVHRLYPN